MKKIATIIFMFTLSTMIISSCKKGPGEGGQATITGKIWVEEWDDATFTVHDSLNDHWGMDEDVYIIYGSDATYGDRIKSGPEGVFEFKYLREGDYTIYVYSKESTTIVPGGKLAIKKSTGIPDDGTTDIGTLTIKN